ncbi:2542_t:CDS:2, partial [Gigaspora margarita]
MYADLAVPAQIKLIGQKLGKESADDIELGEYKGKKVAAKMAVNIANGLLEYHKHNIIHSDLKADNILVNKHLVLKIADFSLSITKKVLEIGEKARGALKWKASECFANYKPYKKYANDSRFSKIFDKNIAKLYNERPKLSDNVSLLKIKVRDGINDLDKILEQKNAPSALRSVIKRCCKFNPIKRIDIEEVVIELQNTFRNIVWNNHRR